MNKEEDDKECIEKGKVTFRDFWEFGKDVEEGDVNKTGYEN